jgi:hypothetical protein
VSAATLWVVSPSYKDVPSFTMLRARIRQEVAVSSEVLSYRVRFVLVDDTAGYDGEVAGLEAFADVTVITPPFNLGHQRALVYGLRTIAGDLDDVDIVVTMDADGEDRPEDLPRLIAPLLHHPDQLGMLCVARRTKRSESLRFKIFYLFFKLMFRSLTGNNVRSGNYAAYRGWLARRMLAHPYFDLCYSATLVSLDLSVTAVPCARGTRYAGSSRMNMLRLFMHGVRMLMPFTDRIAVRALAAFTITFGLGVVMACVVLGLRLFSSLAIPGWTTFTLLGILILSIVALGNFVVLFVVFSHSRGISLANLEEWNVGDLRITPSAPD